MDDRRLHTRRYKIKKEGIDMTVKEVYAILSELEGHIKDGCCTVTMDSDDVKDLITKLRKAIHAYSQEK